MRKTVSYSKQRAFRPRTAVLVAALLSSLVVLAEPVPVMAQAAPQVQMWEVPAGPLNVALSRLATQARVPLTISYSPELVAGRTTQGVAGQHTPIEALERTLAGTGLVLDKVNDTTFALRVSSTARSIESATNRPASRSDASEASGRVTEMERVAVTGTRIKGTQLSSPLVMITQEEMRLSGHNSLGEVVRALPQNFSGGQNPGVMIGAGGGESNQNLTGGSSLNLRGLGADATLTLLNGVRLPYDGHWQATDVAVVPVAAIERIEVLLDGASALYGSDAVGGVANVVIRRDYDGAELVARYGGATAGGYQQSQFSAVVGQTWTTGALLVAGETTHNSVATAADHRDYLRYLSYPDLMTIAPRLSQDGGLLSGYQKLGAGLEISADLFYTKRSTQVQYVLPPRFSAYTTDTAIYGFSPSLSGDLRGDWSFRVSGFTGEDEARLYQPTFDLATRAQVGTAARWQVRNGAKAANVEFEGPLFSLPGGAPRLSFGGGWRKVEYDYRNLVTGAPSAMPGASNTNRFVYIEANFPLVGEGQGVRGINRLSLNGAARYEDYDNFGDTTVPKIGLLWNIVPSLDVRVSWGKSFKAPTLSQQHLEYWVANYPAALLAIPGATSTDSALVTGGGNPALGPERAEVITAGFVFRPTFLPGASIELGLFDIDFTKRIVQPLQFATTAQYGQALSDPSYSDFVSRNPSPAQQAEAIESAWRFVDFAPGGYDASRVIALYNNRYFNASSQVVRGVDLDVRHTAALGTALLSFNVAGSWMTDSRRRLIEGRPEFDTAGVVWFPAKFKGRLGASWSKDRFTLTSTVNHIGGVTNTGVAEHVKGDSMTTFDLVLDYAADPSRWYGLGVSLSAMNLTNQRPPFLQPLLPEVVNYDSTNYSPIGRTVSIAVTKRF